MKNPQRNPRVLPLFFQLMKKDLQGFMRVYRGKFFDTCFLFFTNALIFGYFMPTGLPDTYGPFIVVGAIASFGLFDIVGQVGEILFDIEGDKKITFTLTMPVPYWIIFGQLAIKWALNTFLLCVPLFLIGKLLLWNEFNFSETNFLQLTLMYPTVCIFFGFFSLWLIGIIKKIQSLSALFLRVINPLFMFGGYFFTWHSSFALSPYIGYAILLNPMIYVMEGMRGAVLGPSGYLPFWTCFGVLWGFTIALGLIGIRGLKKRLDCV